MRAINFRRIAGLVAIIGLMMAGLTSAHAGIHVADTIAAKTAPCHAQAKSAQDACKEICASGLADQGPAAVTPAVRTPLPAQAVAYEITPDIFVLSRVPADAWWHPPPESGRPVFLRLQRFLI